MASRSSGGMGVLVALVVFILLSVALLLTTMLFYTKQQKALRAEEQAVADLSVYVKEAERGRDDLKRLVELAKRSNNQSVVGYLKSEHDAILKQAGGQTTWTVQDLRSQMNAVGIADTGTLLATVKSFDQEIDTLENEKAALQNQLDQMTMLANRHGEMRQQLQAEHQAALAELNSRIGAIQALADSYREQVEAAEQDMSNRVVDIREDYEEQLASVNSELESSMAEVASLKDSLASLQERVKSVTIGLTDEAELVDGEVVRALENNEIFISLGARDHIVLGMTFEVYGNAGDVRRDALGNTPRGKGTIEVVRINDTVSTARVIRSTAGQAVVEGDVIVNAIYDRNKEYSFYVFGDFDLDGEAGPSTMETEMIKSRIEEWGGAIRDSFAGDIDYLVLGVEPQRPLPLRPDPTPAEIRRWASEQRFYEEYQEYLERARDLSIPVLNQNRLLTLIGYYRR